MFFVKIRNSSEYNVVASSAEEVLATAFLPPCNFLYVTN